MTERIAVFISSTSRDLTQYRDRVTQVVLRMGAYPIIMEAFNSTDRNVLQLCYDHLQEAQIFIGIYAHRYGYAPGSHLSYTAVDGTVQSGDGETSITHLEYMWAHQRNLPMLLFVVSDSDVEGEPLIWDQTHIEEGPGQQRLATFKTSLLENHVVGFFHSPDHLSA